MKYYTKEIGKALGIVLFSFSIVAVMILLKYKPVFAVELNGEELGYISNKEQIESSIEDYKNYRGNNIAFIDIEELPTYEFKLLNNKIDTNEEEVLLGVQKSSIITYVSYAIKLDGETKKEVRTLEEAEEVVNNIKEEYKDKIDLDLTIEEVYESEDPNDGFVEKEVAKTEISSILDDRIKAKEEEEAKKKAEEAKKAAAAKKAALAKANTQSSSSTSTKTTSQSLGITLSYPISGGKVSSRFGSRSSVRSSAHTGLDLSAPYGTPIHPVSNGTVTFAGTKGSYGKLIIISHGNGVETWYGHCSSINVSAGQSVTTSTTIGAVGSTGNSTGNHLHLEIRKNGTPLNPQNYLY